MVLERLETDFGFWSREPGVGPGTMILGGQNHSPRYRTSAMMVKRTLTLRGMARRRKWIPAARAGQLDR